VADVRHEAERAWLSHVAALLRGAVVVARHSEVH